MAARRDYGLMDDTQWYGMPRHRRAEVVAHHVGNTVAQKMQRHDESEEQREKNKRK